LNKVFDAVSTGKARNSDLFSKDQAIADFGVGKNMVSSMKYWALASGIIEEHESGYCITPLGVLLMGEGGLDPYLESPSSLWLIHWNVASNARRTTTWYWGFGCYSGLIFDQDKFVGEISQLCRDLGWKRVSPTTISRSDLTSIEHLIAELYPGRICRKPTTKSIVVAVFPMLHQSCAQGLFSSLPHIDANLPVPKTIYADCGVRNIHDVDRGEWTQQLLKNTST